MSSIINTIESFKRKRFTGGVSSELIADAEIALNLKIASEYKEVLEKYGSLCVKGEEFLGIDSDNYDIVKATKEARTTDENLPKDVYVIENTAIDGILIVQNSSGNLFSYQPNKDLQTLTKSLDEYLLSL